MLIARVIGTTVSTIKDEKLTGRKLLIVRQTDEHGLPVGKPYVAVDTVGAGIGELVLTAAGSSARQTVITKDCPGGRGDHVDYRFVGSRGRRGIPQGSLSRLRDG